MITTELKQRIAQAMVARRENFGGSDAQYAVSLGINGSIYNRIKNGETDKVLADAKWISLARTLNVQIGGGAEWKTAKTPVFAAVTAQLEFCQNNATLAVLCDDAGIGKTYAAEQYARTHKNVVYADCSQVKTKQQLVRFIAKELGVGYTGMYRDVYADLVFYLRTLINPLIILDEASDLNYPAFLELKALQNKTKEYCGWYMMGADGLRAKIQSGINCKKVGYTEIFDRVLYWSLEQGNSKTFQLAWFVLFATAYDSVEINIENLLINGGGLSRLINIRELTNKLNALVNAFNAHTHAVSAGSVHFRVFMLFRLFIIHLSKFQAPFPPRPCRHSGQTHEKIILYPCLALPRGVRQTNLPFSVWF